MKHTSLLLLLLGLWFSLSAAVEAQPPSSSEATASIQSQAVHLQTALDHITVLEFAEPVTQTAAGSSAFNIEWRDNKVLIKPLKPGVSTDLFVWTASHRFAYELDPPGEVKNMNFAVDNPVVLVKPNPEAHEEAMIQVADMMFTRALLGSDRIESGSIRDEKGRVIVRVESVCESRNSTFIRYSIKNLGDHPYRILDPAVRELTAPDASISLLSLGRLQLDGQTLKKLHVKQGVPVTVSSAETKGQDLRPGEETHGVIVLRRRFATPTVLEIAFANVGDRHVSATFVY